MKAGNREYIQSIIDARPAGVRQLFDAYGIAAAPSPETVKEAFEVFGKPFVGDLVNAVVMPPESADGDTLAANVAVAEQKKSLWENITGVLNGTANVLAGFGSAFGKGSSATTATPVIIQQKAEKKNHTWLYLGIGLLVVIVLVIIVIVKNKK